MNDEWKVNYSDYQEEERPRKTVEEENSRGDGQEENIDFHFHGHFEEKEPEQSNKFESPIREREG